MLTGVEQDWKVQVFYGIRYTIDRSEKDKELLGGVGLPHEFQGVVEAALVPLAPTTAMRQRDLSNRFVIGLVGFTYDPRESI